MEIGVSGVASSRHGDIGVLAKKAEDLGFESIWLPEHPVIPVNHNTKYRGSADGSIPEFMNHQVNPFIGLTLAAAATTLKNRIVDYNRLVDIWVVSDKTTQVSVRGVGQVGQVDKYKIQLKPGRYILEGRREGYRVKAVELTVTPDDRSIDVKVICDERI